MRESKGIRSGLASPIAKEKQSCRKQAGVTPDSKANQKAELGARNKTPPVFQSSDYSSFKRLEKEVKKVRPDNGRAFSTRAQN